MVLVHRGVARVENREGQIIFKGAQPQDGALKRGAEYPKSDAICLKKGPKMLKRGTECLKMPIFISFYLILLSFFGSRGRKNSQNFLGGRLPPLATPLLIYYQRKLGEFYQSANI